MQSFSSAAHSAKYKANLEVTCAVCLLQSTQDSSRGVVYTHWGRDACVSTGARPMYIGYIATSVSTSTAGSSCVCLTSAPRWDGTSDTAQRGTAEHLSRVEYADNSALSMLAALDNFDAVCAVCQAPGRSWALTVSGRTDCPSNHVLDYQGYLMTETYTGAQRRQHICVDGAATGVAGSEAAAPSAALYPTESAEGMHKGISDTIK